jgi:hypothetical protein
MSAIPPTPPLWEIVPLADDPTKGELKFNFHPGQLRAWDSDKRFILVLAGTQGGKTSFGPFTLSPMSCTRPVMRRKSRRSRSSGLSSSFRSSRSGVIHTFSSSFLIISLHRPVLLHHGAHPAPEPAGAAARRGGVHYQRAFAAVRRPLVHAQQRLVVVPPGISDGLILSRSVHQRNLRRGAG